MPDDGYKWNFFISHAGPDAGQAESLYDLLAPDCQVFLDSRSLQPGDDWAPMLDKALRCSRVTVILLSSKTDAAYYEGEEIAAAIDLARRDKAARRVVPVYLDNQLLDSGDIPFGLRSKHAIKAPADGDLRPVAQGLRGLLGKVEIVDSQTEAIGKLTGGGNRAERINGLSEITKFFGPLRWALLSMLVVSVLGIVLCLLSPPEAIQNERALAASGLGALGMGSFSGLMMVINKSVDVARDIARSGLA